jgi:hypothetical protein
MLRIGTVEAARLPFNIDSEISVIAVRKIARKASSFEKTRITGKRLVAA